MLGNVGTYLASLDLSILKDGVNTLFESELAKYGFMFAVAAWFHSGQVRKEIRANFEGLTVSINNLGLALRTELQDHTKMLADHGWRLSNLEKPNTVKPQSQGDVHEGIS